MSKIWVAVAAVMLLLGTPALAASWDDGFKTCDTDNSGTVSRGEWTSCEAKLDPQMNPTFTTMDSNNNNSISKAEWTAGAKQKVAIGNNCQKAEGSWCPCQNNSDDPACQKN